MIALIRPALLVTRREVRDQFRDWRVIFPILGLTIFFPFLMNFTAQQALGFVEKYGATIVAERLIPFLLMVVGFFPISVSLVIALESFVGEKERGSLEPLLNTPLQDWQLYLGKLLSATVPPLFSSYIGMTVYLVGLAAAGIALPPFNVLAQLIALTTVQAVVMVAGAVIVSSQTTSVRAANLLASFIVIPAALLIQGESIVVFWGDFNTLWWAVLGMAILGILMVRVGLAHFRREELLGREIDVLNLRWGWSVFRSSFLGGAQSMGAWYRDLFRRSLPRLFIPTGVVLGLMIVGILIGYRQASVFQIPADQINLQDLNSRLESILLTGRVFSVEPVAAIFWQNLRVLLISLLLGFFSFGVVGVLPSIASLGIVGYLMGFLEQAGIPALLYLEAFILPHGIFEIPAAIIATSGILHMGAVMATPDPNRSVSEIWLTLFGDWCRLMVGVVVPLLVLAASIEVWVTPLIAVHLLR